jgi:uncharacterized damage-inducible protein DinB
MNARELLLEPIAYMPPARAIEGLSTEDAERRHPGANHSIAEIIAHLTFWQEWFIRRCESTADPMPTSAATGWPAVAPGSWPTLSQRFVDGLHRAVEIGEPFDSAQGKRAGLDRPIAPPTEFPALANYSVRDVLTHIAYHNSHHLGQVITIRQMMGCWPPPSGSYTW